MSLSFALLHRLGQLSRTPVALRFRLAAANPAATQERTLRRILAANADTEYGRRYDFAGIRDLDDYRQRVPLVSYDDLRPYIEREKAGEAKVLVGQKPELYARTSGTAGLPKDVPINEHYRAEFQETVLVSTWHLFRRLPHAFTGQLLYFVGAYQIDKAADGTPIGTISGYNFAKMPPLLKRIYAWPAELFDVVDLPSRSMLALLLAAHAEVSLCAGIFPSTMVYLFRYLAENRQRVEESLRTGRLPSDLRLSHEQRQFFAAKLQRPLPERADALAAAHRRQQPLVPALLPGLRLVYCWISASAGAYVPELREQVGDGVAIRDAIYSASEGWCSIPMGERRPGGALAITSHVLELLPVAARERGSEQTLLAHEAELGKQYYIVITSSAGMYRYVLGDIVEVTGHYRNTPTIRFVRKAGAASNVCGEMLDETHVTAAVAEAANAYDVRVSWFAAAPSREDRTPRYRLYLEADSAELPDGFAESIDEALRQACWTYSDRVGTQLESLELWSIPAGSYQAWRQEQVDRGAAESQLKITHLVDDVAKLPASLVASARRC